MIQITKQGTIPALKRYLTNCNYCKCEFTFDATDTVAEPAFMRHLHIFVGCPCCKRKLEIKKYGASSEAYKDLITQGVRMRYAG